MQPIVAPAASMLNGITLKYVQFKLSEFRNAHWRMFEVDDKVTNQIFKFLWVFGNGEILLFVSSSIYTEKDMFIPMKDVDGKLHIIRDGEREFEPCRKIICEEEGWKKEAILYGTSDRKIVRGLCNASLLDPQTFKPICNHHPKRLLDKLFGR